MTTKQQMVRFLQILTEPAQEPLTRAGAIDAISAIIDTLEKRLDNQMDIIRQYSEALATLAERVKALEERNRASVKPFRH